MIVASAYINEIARYVGDNILIPHWGKVARDTKTDGTPVTIVDKQASDYITKALKALRPDIPVISEEASDTNNQHAMNSSLRWVVDPLDGTSTYLDGPLYRNEAGFGVHIALVKDGDPIQGACYFPAQKKLYFVGDDGKAYLQTDENTPEPISVHQSIGAEAINAAVPWVKAKRPVTVNGCDYNPVPAVGGEMLCKVACGEAHLIWHDRPDSTQDFLEREVLSHWDIAAAHAVLKAAGGDVYIISTGERAAYENENFHVPPIVAGHENVLRQIGFYPAQTNHKSNPDFTL